MNKNTNNIKIAINRIVKQAPEIISGTMVSGSLDSAAGTISVQPTGNGMPITNVRLGSITGTDGGIVITPANGSVVVIGSIDGPGEWTLLKASDIASATIKTNNVLLQLDGNGITLQNGTLEFAAGASQFKINSPSESLHQLLHDLVGHIAALTVPTPAGPSSVPVNLADFLALLPRIDALLTH